MTGKSYREAEATLKNILSKHDTLEGNRLSREGFLSYYRDIAAGDPRQASFAIPKGNEPCDDSFYRDIMGKGMCKDDMVESCQVGT